MSAGLHNGSYAGLKQWLDFAADQGLEFHSKTEVVTALRELADDYEALEVVRWSTDKDVMRWTRETDQAAVDCE